MVPLSALSSRSAKYPIVNNKQQPFHEWNFCFPVVVAARYTDIFALSVPAKYRRQHIRIIATWWNKWCCSWTWLCTLHTYKNTQNNIQVLPPANFYASATTGAAETLCFQVVCPWVPVSVCLPLADSLCSLILFDTLALYRPPTYLLTYLLTMFYKSMDDISLNSGWWYSWGDR